MTISPESADRRPTIASTSSVCPLPWTPASATISPARTSRLTPLTAMWSRSSRTWRSVIVSITSPGDRRALDDLELHVAADHQVREDLARRVLGLDRAGDASAAEHRDPVRDLQHLVELVGDEDDGGAGLGQAADDPEQLLRLEGRQDGGRLVQHEDVALAVERLEDLHPLAHADGEVLDLGVRVDVEVVLLAQLDDSSARRLAVERADRPADALGAQRDRLDDVEDGDELEVLVDHADAGVDRLPRVREGTRRPVDQDLARVGLVQARQDVHQGALAGTVLAQQAEDLPAVSGDGDPVVGEHAREALGDVLQLEAHRRLPSLVMQPARPREPRAGGR